MTRIIYILLLTAFIEVGHVGEVWAWEGTVIRIIDGDSLIIQKDGETHEIRLYGIDTPEYKQPYSNKAKQLISRLASRQMVSVVEKDVDRYGRIVALVTSRGKLVNRELVREGVAWFYPRYCRSQPLCGELELLEQQARKARRGLWRDNNPVPPWDWKREQRMNEPKKTLKWYYRFLNWF